GVGSGGEPIDPSSPPRAPSRDDRRLNWERAEGRRPFAAALSPPGSGVAGAAGAAVRTAGDRRGVVRGSRSEGRGSDEATGAPIPERPRGEGGGGRGERRSAPTATPPSTTARSSMTSCSRPSGRTGSTRAGARRSGPRCTPRRKSRRRRRRRERTRTREFRLARSVRSVSEERGMFRPPSKRGSGLRNGGGGVDRVRVRAAASKGEVIGPTTTASLSSPSSLRLRAGRATDIFVARPWPPSSPRVLSVTDANRSLVDDGLVDEEKIGGSGYFRSFPRQEGPTERAVLPPPRRTDRTSSRTRRRRRRSSRCDRASARPRRKLADAKRGSEEDESGERAKKMARRVERAKGLAEAPGRVGDAAAERSEGDRELREGIEVGRERGTSSNGQHLPVQGLPGEEAGDD
ncbi:hypothetical protein ACHAWF_000690, partial [Thalassiosira exigua]